MAGMKSTFEEDVAGTRPPAPVIATLEAIIVIERVKHIPGPLNIRSPSPIGQYPMANDRDELCRHRKICTRDL